MIQLRKKYGCSGRDDDGPAATRSKVQRGRGGQSSGSEKNFPSETRLSCKTNVFYLL